MALNGVEVTQGLPTPEETQKQAPQFPPPKTDKPRPHVCLTCTRSFARLEHLKRHERSHTKEKPFECPQCTRCFARRDLLLRHQQKLHQAGAASTRPRNGRRESTSSMSTSARARKNSMASSVNGRMGAGNSSMRPRANTISHVDTAGLNLYPGMGAGMNGPIMPPAGVYYGAGGHDFRPPMNGFVHHGSHASLPKINTAGLHSGYPGGLRTAPISENFDYDKLFGPGASSTINPAQLHSAGGGYLGSPMSPFGMYPGFQHLGGIDDDEALDFTGEFDTSLILDPAHEHAIDGSSPSAVSSASQGAFSEVMVDGSNHAHGHTSAPMWHQQLQTSPMMGQGPFHHMPMDMNMDTVGTAVMPELMHSVSAETHRSTPENFLVSTPAGMAPISPTPGMSAMPTQYFNPALAFGSDTTSNSSNSINGSARQSSVTSVSSDSITDATRQALIFSLSQPSGFGHRKYSQPTVSSPLSPSPGARASMSLYTLPSTPDLQRYVNAYIHYFHPHMPFLHIPTLSFNTPAFTSNIRSHPTFSGDGVVGGGGCLILAIAAIGALYEFEHGPAKELFEAAKKMISVYLEERRKAGLAAGSATMSGHGPARSQKTPLWLVQAMLLNCIFGNNCGDKQGAEIANTHCAALVSLAKAAELHKSDADDVEEDIRMHMSAQNGSIGPDQDMAEEMMSPTGKWRADAPRESPELLAQWYRWKSQEERKRTLYCIFILSSLLVTAYNHSPRILNSELHLDLPCEEDLYAAGSAKEWAELGGPIVVEQRQTKFAEALSYLLTASQRRPMAHTHPASNHVFGSLMPLDDVPESSLRPSTFGCYILINALHVYIWETRQRHQGRAWKTQETEQMHAQIEPALRAWQSAWKSNPHHTLERPSPYGPLPADSIPLLDLAYVRLFVNLGRSKEEFFHRDFEAMARELGQGVEIIQHADPPEGTNGDLSDATATTTATNSPGFMQSPAISSRADGLHDLSNPSGIAAAQQQASRRERHLRKAAAYAADSLQMADKLGVTFAEFTSRELPLQSALCTMDCVQVLAEWVATVQERVGRYLGVLGRDEVDFTSVPAGVLLGDEDLRLLGKVGEYLEHADVKMAMDPTAAAPYAGMKHLGFGSRLLLVTAYMLEKAAVWEVTHTMARALETHASFLQQRAEHSVGVLA